MAGVGRIVAALASGSQETTVALANLNFDFSLVKVEAPVEFKGLGACLSSKRKKEAECGTVHVTARKLGALFADGLPAIPNLLQAYGRRVTEIAEAPHINPKGSRFDGPFVGHVGADGTTIWAAATSGQGSIATELVMERKAVLQKRAEGANLHFSTAAAALIQLSRDQLAEWDASARAWLRTADEAKQLQQKQLMLILDNISLPVTSNSNVHDDVMEAWKAAMVTLDKLISGMPHRVQSGAVLLGLTSWHLYPDISVLGLTSTQVIQKDPLICPGGVVTIGITDADPSDESGVYWSLPLAYLRHYGRPVKSIGSIGPGTSRVTFEKFLQSVLGRILGGWELDVGNTIEICDLFVALSEYLVADDLFLADPAPFAPKYWLKSLAQAAKAFLSSEGFDRQENERLISFGRRRRSSFLAETGKHPSAIFGLNDYEVLFRLMKGEEERISYLRHKVASLGVDLEGAVIRYYWEGRIRLSFQPETEFATAAPYVSTEGKKRSFYGEPREEIGLHKRWIHLDNGNPISGETRPSALSAERSVNITVRTGEPCGFLGDDSIDDLFSGQPGKFRWANSTKLIPMGQICEHFDSKVASLPESLQDKVKFGWSLSDPFTCQDTSVFKLVFGDPQTAAVYARSESDLQDFEIGSNPEVRDIIYCLKERLIDPDCLAAYLGDLVVEDSNDYSMSLSALFVASQIYSTLPGATVELSVLSKPLHKFAWITDAERLFSQECAFSCIATFKSGSFNIRPEQIENVMAISSGNALYVTERWLCDPLHPPPLHVMRKIVGNIGKPGLAMLIPPGNPKVREPDYDTWNVINHVAFDGKVEDNFTASSLHLPFTGYELVIDVSERGKVDKDVYFIESVVSVYDQGMWVADLDILAAEKEWSMLGAERCYGHVEAEHDDFSELALKCIDSWPELLDHPGSPAIARAKGNWEARLSIGTVSVQKKLTTILLSGNMCWRCVYESLNGEGVVDNMVLIC